MRDREYPFAKDLIGDDFGAPDATLPVLAKVSSLIEVSAAIGRPLGAGLPTVVTVHLDCQPHEC